MKYVMIVLLALAAMAACQGAHVHYDPTQVHVVDNDPTQVHVVDHDPSQVHVVDHDPSQVHVVDRDQSQVHVVDRDPTQVHVVDRDPTQVHVVNNNYRPDFNPGNFVVDPGFALPLNPGHYQPINTDPEFIDNRPPPGSNAALARDG